MFRIAQMISATQLIRRFSEISQHFRRDPQPLLILQKNGQHLVLLDARDYEELLTPRDIDTEIAEDAFPPTSNPQT